MFWSKWFNSFNKMFFVIDRRFSCFLIFFVFWCLWWCVSAMSDGKFSNRGISNRIGLIICLIKNLYNGECWKSFNSMIHKSKHLIWQKIKKCFVNNYAMQSFFSILNMLFVFSLLIFITNIKLFFNLNQFFYIIQEMGREWGQYRAL